MDHSPSYLIVSAICALFLALIKLLYSSKCRTVSCCYGMINVERDIEIELKEDTMQMQNNNKSNRSK